MTFQEFPLHMSTMERFRKTFYYGGCSPDDMPSTDRFSLPVTEICVDTFTKAVTAGAKRKNSGKKKNYVKDNNIIFVL